MIHQTSVCIPEKALINILGGILRITVLVLHGDKIFRLMIITRRPEFGVYFAFRRQQIPDSFTHPLQLHPYIWL